MEKKTIAGVAGFALLHAWVAEYQKPLQTDVQTPPSAAITAPSTGNTSPTFLGSGDATVTNAITDDEYRLLPPKSFSTFKST